MRAAARGRCSRSRSPAAATRAPRPRRPPARPCGPRSSTATATASSSAAAGEPLIERRDLARAAPAASSPASAQLTDAHVRDEESPARVPFLDRLGPPFTSTFRPQEAVSPQVLDAAVRALDRERPQAVVVTGDIVDNAQANELDLALGRAARRAASTPTAARRGYDGVQDAANPDPYYYRPDNDAPRHPGVLAAAQRPFRAAGLRAPWYPAIGNHDVLVAGRGAGDAGDRGGRDRRPDGHRARSATFQPPTDGDRGRARPSTRCSTQGEVLGRAETRPGRPRAPPPGARGGRRAACGRRRSARRPRRTGWTTRSTSAPRVRGIVLDTAARGGGSRGVVSAAQVAWLRAQLARAGDRHVVVFSHNPLEASDGGEAALAALARRRASSPSSPATATATRSSRTARAASG